MKKTLFCLILLVCLLLSGCACQHEWTDADCLNPQVCTKCEETAGEDLGHDWAAATCTAPETCSRCGETQRTALEHTFGDWNFHNEEMTHVCTVCSTEQTLPIDRELYLETLLSGHWYFRCLIQQGQRYYASSFESRGYSLDFGEDRKAVFFDFEQEHFGTWKFIEYKNEDGDNCYYFCLVYNGTENGPFLLVDHMDEADQLYIFFDGNAQAILSRNATLSKLLVDTWKYATGDIHWNIIFTEDHRVYGDIGEPFTGTWYLLEEFVLRFESQCYVIIELDVDGNIVKHRAKVYSGKPGIPSENNTANHAPRLEWQVGNQPVYFTKQIKSLFRE